MSESEFPSIEAAFPCRVHWGDCDPAGIIFYPTYFRWMDAASWAFFESVGYDAARFRAEHRAMPLVSADCRFKAPAIHGDRCEVRSRIARFGGKSFVVAHRILRSDGELLAEGTETRVWGRYAAGPGTPLRGEEIPEAVKALFRAAAGAPAGR
ncbi:MAG: acyl-CoA thioesterase [Pseudomonadota bacterium]